MLGNYNGGSFQCYFSKDESLDAIFLNSDSFNGIDPIFPIEKQEVIQVPVAI
jgi:hypothetical protein